MRSRSRRASVWVALATAMAIGGRPPEAAVRPTVAVVMTSSIGPFAEAVSALRERFEAGVVEPEILVFDLEGRKENAPEVLERVRGAKPDVIVSVGTLATAAVLAERLTTPLVYSMVLYPAQGDLLDGAAGPVTGAALDIPLDVQFRTLRRLVPDARRVGVLYNPSETGRLVESARAVAKRHGLELEARAITRAEDTPAAFEALLEDVDAIWSVADSHVFTRQSTAAIVLAALRARVPMLGLSGAHVRTGALAALSCRYADIGTQTAELAERVLRGESPAAIPATNPRDVTVELNLRTARHLGLTIDPAVEREAAVVVR